MHNVAQTILDHARPSSIMSALNVLHSVGAVAATIVPLSLVVFIYERALIPIYASEPTQHALDLVILAALCLSAFQPFAFTTSQKALACGLLLAIAPNATYWIPVWTARNRNPTWGPAISHSIVLLPLVAAMSSFLKASSSALGRVGVAFVTTALPCILILLAKKSAWNRLTLLNTLSESHIFLALSIIYTCVSISQLHIPSSPSSTKSSSKKRKAASSFSPLQTKSITLAAFLALASTIYPRLVSPVLPHPLPKTYTHPNFPLQIHSSVQSTTGLIVVGESLKAPPNATDDQRRMSDVRYLRAAHSLLGGVWMGTKVMTIDNVQPLRDSRGRPLGDSIYGAFTLQEAARLVNSTNKEAETALIIGLGAGISATAFKRHNLEVSIVEIDPAVYDAARAFFGLPDPGQGHVFIEDARGWAAKRRASVEAGNEKVLFDIAVHDCFSGGGVPQHIFTLEFWHDLKSVMNPEGILVVNYAGYLYSDPMRLVAQTLLTVFGQCKAFHDLMEPTQEALDHEFLNVAFFCTSSSTPLSFRQSTSVDWLGSPLRRHVLSALPIREVALSSILASIPHGQEDEFVLTDGKNRLGKLQEEQGDHHWALMRDILPDLFWETY